MILPQLERFYDEDSSFKWKELIKEKVRQFGVAISEKTGYDVVLRLVEHADRNTTVYYVDIAQIGESHVFIVTDFSVEYRIHKRV